MNRRELQAMATTLTAHRQDSLARQMRELPIRLERQLSVKATELSTQALGAVVARLQGFRQELADAIAQLPAQAQQVAREQHRQLERILTDTVSKRLDASLTKLANDCRTALEAMKEKEADCGRAAAIFRKQCQATEETLTKTLEQLSATHEAKRLELAKEFETRSVTPILADTYRGNWSADVLYKRGETFSFRGGWHLVLRDSLGRPPGNATLRGPAPAYALLAAPGAPGVNTTTAGSSSGGSNYVAPPLVPASAVQGQWTFDSGYMYWAVANGVVRKWAVTP